MANQNDSFIDEVTEDLRRDRLFVAMRRYGWVVLLLILAIVAGAAWREYSRARADAQAQAFGDALLAAEAAADPAAALMAVDAHGAAGRAAVARMLAADVQFKAGDRNAATATLAALGADTGLPPAIRDLARLKVLTLGAGTDAGQRDALLSELSAPGAPYRLLALEQKAIALIEAGRDDDAASLIRKIQQEQGLSENMRRRLSETLITLGVEADPAPAPMSSAASQPPDAAGQTTPPAPAAAVDAGAPAVPAEPVPTSAPAPETASMPEPAPAPTPAVTAPAPAAPVAPVPAN